MAHRGSSEVVQAGGVGATTHVIPARPRRVASEPRRRLSLAWLSLVLLVALPTVATATYLAVFAPSEYVAEARFVVRNASDDQMRQMTTDFLSLASMLGGPKSNPQDAHIVVGYLQGRSVIDDLGGKEVVERLYSRPDIDWLSRLSKDSPFEDIWKYWRRKVSAVLDVPSGIITLDVRAFSREEARDIAARLVQLSERLVNEMSERARMDTLRRAETELRQARQKVEERRDALSEFRNKQELLDPLLNVTSIGESLAELTREKLKLENQAAVMQRSMASQAPTLRTLRAQLTNIDEQIRKLEAQLASNTPDRRVLASQIAGYERLQLELKFSEKLYEVAENAFTRAQLEMRKQQLFLVTIVRPTMPEDALYPRPVRDTLLLFVWLAILWSVSALIFAGIRDHR